MRPILLGAVCWLMSLGGAVMAEVPQGIHVQGQGELQVEPDMARVELQVSRQGRDAAALKRELDGVTAAVLELTDRLDIERKDVTAAGVNVYPNRRHENGKTIMDGVVAARSIQVTVRDLARLGPLLNDALDAGVNQVGNIALDVADRVKLEQRALDAAIADALREAGQIARGFSVRLMGVLNVTSDPHSVRPQLMRGMAMEAADSGDAFSPGQITISRTIQATFAIGGQ